MPTAVALLPLSSFPIPFQSHFSALAPLPFLISLSHLLTALIRALCVPDIPASPARTQQHPTPSRKPCVPGEPAEPHPLATQVVIPAASARTQRHDQSQPNLPPRRHTHPEHTSPSDSHLSARSPSAAPHPGVFREPALSLPKENPVFVPHRPNPSMPIRPNHRPPPQSHPGRLSAHAKPRPATQPRPLLPTHQKNLPKRSRGGANPLWGWPRRATAPPSTPAVIPSAAQRSRGISPSFRVPPPDTRPALTPAPLVFEAATALHPLQGERQIRPSSAEIGEGSSGHPPLGLRSGLLEGEGWSLPLPAPDPIRGTRSGGKGLPLEPPRLIAVASPPPQRTPNNAKLHPAQPQEFFGNAIIP